jgi:hypothetical protein
MRRMLALVRLAREIWQLSINQEQPVRAVESTLELRKSGAGFRTNFRLG